MGEIRNANPEQLDELARRLRAQDDGGAYGQLVEIFERARNLDVSAEVSGLQPLLTWLYEAAEQLRESATLLRGDDPASTVPSPYAPGNGGAVDLTTQLRAASWEVTGQDQADEFIELAEQETLTEEGLRQMSHLLAQWEENPDFAGYLVDEMGMDEYLRLAQRIDDALASPDNRFLSSNPGLSFNLTQQMGEVLASSLQVPGDMGTIPLATSLDTIHEGYTPYQDWVENNVQGQRYQARLDAFNEAGMQTLYTEGIGHNSHYVGTFDGRTGYDVAMDLLEQSDVPIDEQFFNQTMNHLIDLELEDPDAWSTIRYLPEDGRYPPEDPTVPPKNDVVDRLLGIGAQNPDAVESFFDPEDTNRLEYFIGSGENTRQTPYEEMDSPGLAAALEAASTGVPPGITPDETFQGHSLTNVRIAEAVWNTFAAEYESAPSAEDVEFSRIIMGGEFESLRPALGQIAASYIPDIQLAITGKPIEPPPETAADFDNEGHTEMLLYELGKDPGTYRAVTAANEAFTYLTVDSAINGQYDSDEATRSERVEWASEASGTIAGLMADARSTAVYDQQIAEDEEFNASVEEVQGLTDLGLSFLTGSIPNPVVSELAGWAAEDISASIFGTVQADHGMQAEEQGARQRHEARASHRDDVIGGENALDLLERLDGRTFTDELRDEPAFSPQGGALWAAFAHSEEDFTTDEIRDITTGAVSGSGNGFDQGSSMRR
jgi:hypothetical protein